MKRTFITALTAAILAVTGSCAFAQSGAKPDENSLSGKAMRDQPGNNARGTTANPTAKPSENSLSGKAMRDQPGNNARGATDMPTAKPEENSLSGKAMRELPGNR